MSWNVTAVIAVPFAASGDSFDLTIGATTYTVTLTSGTYRVGLAPSSGTVRDCLRDLLAALNAPSPSLPGGVSFTVDLSPTTGLVSITCSSAFSFVDFHTTTIGLVLGYLAASAAPATAQAGARAPWYLAQFVSAHRTIPQPRTPGGTARTGGGAVYSLAGSGTSYDARLDLDFLPISPAVATEVGSPSTPSHPAEEYLNDLGGVGTAARAWSLLDVLAAARNVQVALTTTWATCRTSTTERYLLPYLMHTGLDLEVAHRDERWPRYATARVPLTLPTAGSSETRA